MRLSLSGSVAVIVNAEVWFSGTDTFNVVFVIVGVLFAGVVYEVSSPPPPPPPPPHAVNIITDDNIITLFKVIIVSPKKINAGRL